MLLEEPDLLLLDEPTNHLDVEATEHLEARLRDWKKAFVLVSHDRYFLRAVCRRHRRARRRAQGDRSIRVATTATVVEREERHERLNAAYERQAAEIARTEDFIRKNIAGQKTKQAKSRRKMLDKVERLSRHQDEFAIAGNASGWTASSARRCMRAARRRSRPNTSTSAMRARRRSSASINLIVYRGDLRRARGAERLRQVDTAEDARSASSPDPVCRRSHARARGAHRLLRSEAVGPRRGSLALIDEIRTVRGDFNEDVARNFLGRFRFTGDDGFKKVKGLSGGERNRLTLAKMMLRPRNLLALDEPTNHLDIPAREVLEEALADYEGTLLVISHDRYFLDRVVTKIVHIHDGRAEEHVGNYTDSEGARTRVQHRIRE